MVTLVLCEGGASSLVVLKDDVHVLQKKTWQSSGGRDE